MNLNFLKLLAFVSMVIDHIGFFLFPDVLLLRLIGRLAFPLFAFILAYNYLFHTKSPEKYISRLLLFASLSQLPYWVSIGPGLNIFFTLCFGLLVIFLGQFSRWALLLLLVPVLAFRSVFEYGLWGIVLPGVFFCLLSWPKSRKPLEEFLTFPVTGNFGFMRSRLWYWFYPVHLLALAGLRSIIA